MLFQATCARAAVVSARLAYSSASAAFSAYAFAPSFSESRSRSVSAPAAFVAPASRSRVSVCRMPVMPSSDSTALTSSPDADMRPSPSMKVAVAPAASVPHACRNSAAVTPDTLAMRFSDLPPSRTALSMSFHAMDMAVPPASASMPTDAMAFA